MANQSTRELNLGRKALLAAAAVAALAGPVAIGLMNPAPSRAQAETPLSFEVASVKPHLADDEGTQWNPQHGNFSAENAPLRQLIRLAYQVPAPMISGPGWLDSLRYDINAKGHGDAPESQVMSMLQTLLADRFHLQLHRETKEMAVYFLVVANGGLKMQSADGPNPTPFPAAPPGARNVIQEGHATLAEFAGALSVPAGRPVLDRTGVPGTFRLRLWYTRTTTAESEAPDLFAALREQLGLRLEPGRGPVETLIVDHADKVPTED